MLSVLGCKVFAVVREHADVEITRRRLAELGAAKVLIDDDFIRERIEETEAPLPVLAFDGVGGEGTKRVASALSRTGNLLCYGHSGGDTSQTLPSGWGKRWRGVVTHFSLDEWLAEDMPGHTEQLTEGFSRLAQLLRTGRFRLDIKEHPVEDFSSAWQEARRAGKTHGVVLLFPDLGDGEVVRPSEELGGPSRPEGVQESAWGDGGRASDRPAAQKPTPVRAGSATTRQLKGSWDEDLLDWDAESEIKEPRLVASEGALFQHDKVAHEMRIMAVVDDALATPVAMELGTPKGKASAVLIWLPGPTEVPEEHGPWLGRLVAAHRGLRAVVLKPRLGTKWYDLSDHEAVKLGLRFGVLDDYENNPEGDPALSSGAIAFRRLEAAEVEAAQQVESAAIGLARRVALEERAFGVRPGASCLPFFIGGGSQGGAIALFTAICLLPTPVRGVAFCHSGVPSAALLGKRLPPQVRAHTQLYAVYDRADKEVPVAYPEVLCQMFGLLKYPVTLEWLYGGDGHDFFEDASAKVTNLVKDCLRADLASTEDPGDDSRDRSGWRQ